MIRFLLGLCAPLLLVPVLSAFAGEPDTSCKSLSPFLFKIEMAGKTSFILGTMHLGIPLSAYPEAVYSAFQSADRVAFENDLDAIKNTLSGELRARAKLPEGQSLSTILNAQSVRKLEKMYGSEAAANLLHYRPWAVGNKIESDAEDLIGRQDSASWNRDDGIDSYLTREAKRSGKPIHFIDRNRDFVADIEAYTTPKDLDDLLTFPDPFKRIADCAHLGRSAFCSGREERIEEYNASGCETKGMTTIIDRRTRAWMTELEDLLQAGNAFVAVGASHVVGSNGLIALLKLHGYKVTRVNP